MEYLRSQVGPRIVLPSAFQLPGPVSLTVFTGPTSEGSPRAHVLVFRAQSVEVDAAGPPLWPVGDVQLYAMDFDGRKVSLVGENQTIRFCLDLLAPVTLRDADATDASLQAQQLSVEMPSKAKSLIAPQTGPIFTPPPEYYIPRDIQSAVKLLSGIGLFAFGWYLIIETGGYALFGWVPVLVGAYILVAVVLDLALFPPWRFWNR
ncbi:MAG TPA: hypothetical protein VJN22_08270 [Candidatus Eremiobacteraceae bacterium]|nr:hypothetical protein [Candidatus Eremiobacteraceae bacterium]